MDFCDTSVRVLYDFEYTTKYGRNIKITSGERLLLIKKTNNDWWQVIRNSEQRPFFVPASYIQEVEANHSANDKHQSKTKFNLDKTQLENAASSSNFLPSESLKTTKISCITIENETNNKPIPRLPTPDNDVIISKLKKEITNPPKIKTLSSTMSSSGYNSLCEEIPVLDEEETSFNVVDDSDSNPQYKSNDSLTNDSKSTTVSKSADSSQGDVIVDPTEFDKGLSGKVDNRSNTSGYELLGSKLHNFNECTKYSTVNNPKVCASEVSNLINPTLPASESLEKLSLQIELKTSSLRNIVDTNSIHSGVSMNNKNIFSSTEEEVSKIECVSTDSCHVTPKEYKSTERFTKDLLQANLKKIRYQESKSSESVCGGPQLPADNNNLQYRGSFKTNTERQRWFKKGSSEKRLRSFYSCSEEDNLELRAKNGYFGETNNTIGSTVTKSSAGASTSEESVTVIANTKEGKACSRTDESLQQSDNTEKLQLNRFFCFGSDSQLSHLKKTTRERTTSRHSLDSVVEGELKEKSTQVFDHRKHKSKELFDSVQVTDLQDIQQANSEKSSTDSLLDIENYGNYTKVSGGTTSDSLVPTDGEDLFSSDSETDSVKLTKSKLEDSKTGGSNARKIPLTRRRRVFTSKSRLDLAQDPLSPLPNQAPTRTLTEGWGEYDTQDGRKYFYNNQTKEKRWKPPRRNHNANVETQGENETSGAADTDDMFVVSLPLPIGWRSEIDSASGQTCYINFSGAKWFSSTDGEGRVYFFEENSNKSSWTLPESFNDSNDSKVLDTEENSSISNLPVIEKPLNRYIKSKSMILATRYEEPSSLSNSSHNWPQLWEGTMCVLKEGPLNKTKITENGKRVRKNWTSTHAVLTELLLLFFKDNKGFPSMMNGHGRPELSVDLNGAVIDVGDKVSSRRNVYMLSTMLGLQVLIQCDCSTTAHQWLQAIQATIDNLPSGIEAKVSRPKPESPSEEGKLNSRIGRSKSMKLKNKSASIEDMSVNIAERQTKIKERLRKFFHRRPTVELLVKKGIWKDEPVFGCLLEQASPPDPPRVPLFVQHCIRCIESSEENMKTDGLYRASGNLSQVQKIRLQVDQNLYTLLEQEEDVHVLAGTLKLFFRELKQPLIPFKFFNKALHASTNHNRIEKIREFRDIVKSLPTCNHDTLKLLLQHLLRVTQYQEHNRMHIPNLAIVFGPTLMWPEQESLNMAFDLMQQNLVIECFLTDFHTIFP